MPFQPFEFLLDLPEPEGQRWLARYLQGEVTTPAIRVPHDLQPLVFLLHQITPLSDPALPRRVGSLAGALLAERLVRGAYRTGDIDFIKALFTLLESLPLPDDVEEFLNDLAAGGRLIGRPLTDGTDLHLLTLRCLVWHQRPRDDDSARAIDLWRREARDVRYAPIAIQGLLRLSVPAAIEAFAILAARAPTARPQLLLANVLFVVSAALGGNRQMWESLVSALARCPGALETVREAFAKTGLPRSNPVAWQALHISSQFTSHSIDTQDLMSMGDILVALTPEEVVVSSSSSYREYPSLVGTPR